MGHRTAVVTIAHGRHEHLERQHRSLARSSSPPEDYIVVAMGDPGIREARIDGLQSRVISIEAEAAALPLAAARNSGVGAAFAAQADVVIGLDVDCMASAELVDTYRTCALRHRDTVWSGPVTYLDPPGPQGYDLAGLQVSPHPARPQAVDSETWDHEPGLFWSLSFALHREAWNRSQGFCEEFSGYGAEDTDFAVECARRGLRLAFTGAAHAFHQHHPVSRPPVEHVDAIVRNANLFYRRWGWWPMEGWLSEFEAVGLIERRDGKVRVLIRPAEDR